MADRTDEALHDVNAHLVKQVIVPNELEQHFKFQNQAIAGLLNELELKLPSELSRQIHPMYEVNFREGVWEDLAFRVDRFTAGGSIGPLSFEPKISDIPGDLARGLSDTFLSTPGTNALTEVKNFFEGRLTPEGQKVLDSYLEKLAQNPDMVKELDLSRVESSAFQKLEAIQSESEAIVRKGSGDAGSVAAANPSMINLQNTPEVGAPAQAQMTASAVVAGEYTKIPNAMNGQSVMVNGVEGKVVDVLPPGSTNAGSMIIDFDGKQVLVKADEIALDAALESSKIATEKQFPKRKSG
jgi:hypothetical protein